MDQYLVAMAAVIAFASFVLGYVVRSERKSRQHSEPTEHGVNPL